MGQSKDLWAALSDERLYYMSNRSLTAPSTDHPGMHQKWLLFQSDMLCRYPWKVYDLLQIEHAAFAAVDCLISCRVFYPSSSVAVCPTVHDRLSVDLFKWWGKTLSFTPR